MKLELPPLPSQLLPSQNFRRHFGLNAHGVEGGLRVCVKCVSTAETLKITATERTTATERSMSCTPASPEHDPSRQPTCCQPELFAL